MNISLHPFVTFALLGSIAAIVTSIFACRASGKVARIFIWLLALLFITPAILLFLAMRPEIIDARFRTYKSFYKEIELGMTRDEVISLMHRFYPDSGPRLQPTMSDSVTNLWFVMNPEKFREPNCEGILLILEAGRVTKKEYSPD